MKKYLVLFVSIVLCTLLCVSASADSMLPRLFDGADVLSASEEEALAKQLDLISDKHTVDVVVHTLTSIGNYTAEECADDIFEQYNYGMGSDRSCILLMIGIEEREWHITTSGYGIVAVTDVGLEHISDKIVPFLSDGRYYDAFAEFVSVCDEFVEMARNGDPFDADNVPKEPFPFVRNLLICLVIGIIFGCIRVGKLKAQLVTVRRQKGAAVYTREGSMNVTDSKDIFLYRILNKTEKADNSSGGSSTHKTSSGNTVGGGGGKF
ncbi:MAG: TPM domain-containing protein [Clostridia bacterium]|nr:TPM domain-containing protein [Clostridia bacterium]